MSDNQDVPLFARSNINLASAKLGAVAIKTSDDFFAAMGRMLAESEPVFIPGKYDDNGKWMDGWESRRRRVEGHDWCIVRLAARGIVHGFDIDTRHFTGNYPPGTSIEVCDVSGDPDEHDAWREIVPRMALGGDQHHYVEVEPGAPVTHLRLNIFPDGGVARLRAYGRALPENLEGEIDFAAALNGGRCLDWNDSHFGGPQCLLYPGRGENMGDGWETRRRREPGNDWLILALARPGIIERIVVDTIHFKGNYPDRCSIEGAFTENGAETSKELATLDWREVMAPQKLQMDLKHEFSSDLIQDVGKISHVRLNIFPDGGVSRLRLFGQVRD